MCGPTGIGALYGRAEILDSMPPWHGGGEMIVSVTLEKSAFKRAPHRFEAARPTSPAQSGSPRPSSTLSQSDAQRFSNTMRNLPGTRWNVSLNCPDAHPRTVRGAWRPGWFRDGGSAPARSHNIRRSVRVGYARRHHCNQPLMRRFGLPGTTRASFYFYNTKEEIDRMIEILHAAVRFFS